MVADLLEPHEEGQHDALALDAINGLEVFGQLAHGLLVEGGLFLAQAAERLDLSLVGKIGDDRLVSLEAAEDVWAHQRAQRPIGVVFLVGQVLCEAGKCLSASQEAGV